VLRGRLLRERRECREEGGGDQVADSHGFHGVGRRR
jgi:hypothetical protein